MKNIKNIRRMGGLQSNQRLNANSYSSKRSEGGEVIVKDNSTWILSPRREGRYLIISDSLKGGLA